MEINSLFDVKGKVVLVTGGARGIGLMISEAYIRNGAKVYIASRDAAACEKAAKELTALGPGTAHAIPADLLQHSECVRLAAELTKRETQLDILVNNSGATWGAPLEEFPDAAWSKVLTLNLQRVFTLTQVLLPLLKTSGAKSVASGTREHPASVINIGSIDALRVPLIESYSYSAAKAGLHHLTRVLSQKLGPEGITVNTVACGPFETKMMKHTLENMRGAIEEGNPMGRIGLPGDVAGACLFLGSRAGSYVNGATLNVDGGVHLAAKM